MSGIFSGAQWQLSGGEREIGFLVGQIDRFGLREGLFLLDEPELHLNADLIRSWVAYLSSTVSTGQIWLATHSLEAIEAAGQQATFILERDEVTKKVSHISRLDSRPELSALSRSVGTPAFSISQLTFVFVEGEESVGERERFRKLSGPQLNVRFMVCGSCKEVMRRVAVIRALAKEADRGIRIGGVIDRDFLAPRDIQKAEQEEGVHVLAVHEVENFFLDPETVKQLPVQNGHSSPSPHELVLSAADARAGNWIFQYAMATDQGSSLLEINNGMKSRIKQYTWQAIDSDQDAFATEIVALSRFDATEASKLKSLLEIGVRAYARKRVLDALWKECEGKQVLNGVALAIGFSDARMLSTAAFALWERGTVPVPAELQLLRAYLSQR